MRSVDARATAEFLLIFDQGDDVSSTLLDFTKRSAIPGGSFTAIGALSDATIAYWNKESKQYENIAVEEQVEVVSMIGNIAQSSDGPKLHAHIVLGKRDGSTVAGHFVRGVVFPTLEVFLTARELSAVRKKDPETDLWLLST